jgi:hypothetical protein
VALSAYEVRREMGQEAVALMHRKKESHRKCWAFTALRDEAATAREKVRRSHLSSCDMSPVHVKSDLCHMFAAGGAAGASERICQ